MRVLCAILTISLLWPRASSGQTYDFQNFTVEHGLSQSQVLCLFQSADGELWLGTNQGGINRYNGSEFSYLAKVDGLSDNVVYAICEDRNGNMLVGTNNGLNILNGSSIDTIGTDDGLTHKGVVSIHLSEDDKVWLGTGSGVCNLIGDSIVPFTEDSLLSASTVLTIREGVDGTLWFCTTRNGLFRWNGTEMTHIDRSNGLKHNYVFDAMPLGRYDAWVFGNYGLYHIKNNRAELMDTGMPEGTIFYGYQRDKAGDIWIGTSKGVLKYHDGDFSLLTTVNGLVDNNIWKIMQDREGNLWFASKSNGVSKLNSERFKLYNSAELPDLQVNAVFKDRQGRIWLGTRKGAVIWQNGTYRVFRDSDGLSSENIRDFDQDANGNI